jgi:hypothetical protein
MSDDYDVSEEPELKKLKSISTAVYTFVNAPHIILTGWTHIYTCLDWEECSQLNRFEVMCDLSWGMRTSFSFVYKNKTEEWAVQILEGLNKIINFEQHLTATSRMIGAENFSALMLPHSVLHHGLSDESKIQHGILPRKEFEVTFEMLRELVDFRQEQEYLPPGVFSSENAEEANFFHMEQEEVTFVVDDGPICKWKVPIIAKRFEVPGWSKILRFPDGNFPVKLDGLDLMITLACIMKGNFAFLCVDEDKPWAITTLKALNELIRFIQQYQLLKGKNHGIENDLMITMDMLRLNEEVGKDKEEGDQKAAASDAPWADVTVVVSEEEVVVHDDIDDDATVPVDYEEDLTACIPDD